MPDAPTCRRLIGRGHSLVAHVGDTTAGFLLAEPVGRELHIRALLVAPAFGRRGIGSGLVRACLIDARNVGFRAVRLTTCRQAPWMPFTARLGFVVVAGPADHPHAAALPARDKGDDADRFAMIRFLD